jgi:hypothetical protein
MCNKQLQALQEAFERCRAEMKSQREELYVQRRKIESFFVAQFRRVILVCVMRRRSESSLRQSTFLQLKSQGPAAEAPPRNGNGSRVTGNAKRSRNCFVCGEPGHFARDHRSADGPKSIATDGPTGQARGITASESPADV